MNVTIFVEPPQSIVRRVEVHGIDQANFACDSRAEFGVVAPDKEVTCGVRSEGQLWPCDRHLKELLVEKASVRRSEPAPSRPRVSQLRGDVDRPLCKPRVAGGVRLAAPAMVPIPPGRIEPPLREQDGLGKVQAIACDLGLPDAAALVAVCGVFRDTHDDVYGFMKHCADARQTLGISVG